MGTAIKCIYFLHISSFISNTLPDYWSGNERGYNHKNMTALAKIITQNMHDYLTKLKYNLYTISNNIPIQLIS